MPQKTSLRRDAKTIFEAALAAAHAGNAVRAHLSVRGGVLKAANHRFPLQAFDRVFLITVGKAAVEMAGAVEAIAGKWLAGGIAITKHGHAQRRLRRIPISRPATRYRTKPESRPLTRFANCCAN